jgi:cardiolipin synthase
MGEGSKPPARAFRWLPNGREALGRMLEAIEAARHRIRFEFYIFRASPIGDRFRDALTRAAERGVCVEVLLDGLGARGLPADYWDRLRGAGGDSRLVNPLSLRRLAVRNHRKLIVCDDDVAFVGGLNVAPEYAGDGVNEGWRDLALEVRGPLVARLAESFDEMRRRTGSRPLLSRFRRRPHTREAGDGDASAVLLGGPDLRRSALRRALMRDLGRARDVSLVSAYFYPPVRMRRLLRRVARRGGRVRLFMAGKTDIPLSRLAAQSLYQRFLRSGVEIHEYQPQILHSKLFVIDDAVYVGSANLDIRGLYINYELLLRLTDPEANAGARQIVDDHLRHSLPIDPTLWPKQRSLFRRVQERWAALLLARLDPYLTRWLAPAAPSAVPPLAAAPSAARLER